MWMECSPGGSDRISSLMRTPGLASVSVAVPTLCPAAFLISTTTGFGAGTAAAGDPCTAAHASMALAITRKAFMGGDSYLKWADWHTLIHKSCALTNLSAAMSCVCERLCGGARAVNSNSRSDLLSADPGYRRRLAIEFRVGLL